MKITVYHGSSNKNLKFNPNKPLMYFTTKKEDARDWADRVILGGKKSNTGSYVYTVELSYNKLYEEGDDFNPEYAEYENSEEKDQIWSEIFFEDIHERREELVKAGFDCFHIELGDDIEYYIIPYECRKNIKWINKETISESIDTLEKPETILNSNFKKWFKNSKIVDEHGNPLVCYHGTPNAGFEEFKPMSHFTKNKDYADHYQSKSASSIVVKQTADNPQTYAVYLSIQNPFDTRDSKAKNIFLNEYRAYYSPELTSKGMIDWMEAEDLIEWLQENHPEYDGLLVDEGGEGGYGTTIKDRGISIIPFNPNQIKSVHNKGSWSSSKNIYEQLNEILQKYLKD